MTTPNSVIPITKKPTTMTSSAQISQNKVMHISNDSEYYLSSIYSSTGIWSKYYMYPTTITSIATSDTIYSN